MRTSRYHYITLVLLFFFVATSAQAQIEYWKPAPGPYGGTAISDLEVTADGVVYAATSNGVYVSTDDGRNWTDASDWLVVTDVRDLMIREDGSMWAVAYGAGLFKWNAPVRRWDSAGLAQTFATSIVESADGNLVVGSIGFAYLSVDNGISWQAKSLDGFQVNIQDLANNNSYLFAASSLGVFRSSDSGETWEFASFGIQELDIRSVEMDLQGNVYAGVAPTSGGCVLYRSRGNGSIWTCIQPTTDPLLVPVLKMGPNGFLYAGGYRNVLYTENEGNTWQSIPASGSTVDAILFTGTSMLIGSQGLGILRSETAGSSWEVSNSGMQSRINSVTALDSGRILVGTEGGLFQSTDYSDSWDRVHPSDPLIQPIKKSLLDPQGRIIVATAAGIWRHDDQTGWQALGPPGMPSIKDITLRENGNILASYYSGIYEFDGSNWFEWMIQGFDQGYRDVTAVHVTDKGTVLAGAAWDSWRQVAGSTGWDLMSAGSVPWFDAQTFAQDGNTILGGTKFLGVVQSQDDGATWAPLGSGLMGREDVQDVQFDHLGRAHIGTYGSGVFQLNPWTKVWVPVNYGLEDNHRVISLAFDADGNGYVGTVDGGLYRHIVSRSVSVEGVEEVPDQFRVGAPYPNPVRTVLSVPFFHLDSGVVEVEVFDMLGHRVVYERSIRPRGDQELSISVNSLASGSYVLRIRTQDQVGHRTFIVLN